MVKTRSNKTMTSRGGAVAVAVGLALSAGTPPVLADDNAEARFRGTGRADPIRIENVRRTDGPAAGQSSVTFDLAWDHSWRAAWKESADRHGGTSTLSLENWDAAWVFVKFRKPGDDGWSHATLSTSAADHSVPTGASLDVGRSDDSKRGLGVFVYRAAPGSGPNDFKGVTLRWLHQADGVTDPKAAELKVLAVQMVYVPQCPFWAGDGLVAQYVEEITWSKRSRLAGQFSAGSTSEPLRIESEAALTLGGESEKNLGNRDGVGLFSGDDFAVRQTQTLPAAFPKGYAAFYCMRHEITEGEYAEFLNTTGSGRQEQRALVREKEGVRLTGIQIAVPGKPGTPAVYKSAAPHVACGGLMWSDCVAYAAWAGLRAMTELEYEKACRGPLRPVPGEHAWGTAGIVGADYRGKKSAETATHDGYAVLNAGQSDERVVWQGEGGPDATRGNAAWDGAVRRKGKRIAADAVARPLRAGIFATPTSGRVEAGASYWGILDLSGNVGERVVPVGNPVARRFAGMHGEWPTAAVTYHAVAWFRGGAFDNWQMQLKPWNDELILRTSNRSYRSVDSQRTRRFVCWGFRCVRTATAGRTPVPFPEDELAEAVKLLENAVLSGATVAPSAGKDPAVKIENVTVAPRDAKTATVSFDISWRGGWRSKVNHDAAWVFFKVRADDRGEWQHVRLAADKVLNPTGYGPGDGTPLECIVPSGEDGFVGMFVRRAAEGTGDVAARRLTAVWDLTANQGIPKDLKVRVQGLGILMVYVPEGAFFLGSDGLTPGGFYKYTDGSQHALPYHVTGPGAIPTGRQAGRLWAGKGDAQPEDGGEIPASFPNGYAAFYCMKYHISPEQYAAFLNALGAEEADRRYSGVERCLPPRIIYSGARPRVFLDETSTPARFAAKPGGPRGGVACFGLSWEDGAAFAAWAGLRPMTELELEKAVRGTRKPIPEEVGPSYWGVQTFANNTWNSYKGDPQCERPVTVANAAGRKFKGTHGHGTTTLPADWPQADAVGSGVRCTYYTMFQLDLPRARVSDRLLAGLADPQRLFSHRWRGVRTAPAGVGP